MRPGRGGECEFGIGAERLEKTGDRRQKTGGRRPEEEAASLAGVKKILVVLFTRRFRGSLM
jgi:hypothetical protein